MPRLPAITWPDFLSAAPYFQGAIGRGLEDGDVLDVAPLHRAAYFYNLFDGEISNGGVIQYFYNQGLSAPGFARAPDFVAENPVLAPALPFLRAVHAAWASVAPAIERVRGEAEWPERLFEAHRARFEALERDFFACNHGIAQRLAADIVARPHAYFTIAPLAEVPERGVAHVALRGGSRLRFEDGFPVGPNILERRRGGCDVVWFSRDRTLLTAETGYGGTRTRAWIHYPTQRSGAWTEAEDGSRQLRPTLALGAEHGLGERFRLDGSLESAAFSRDGRPVWSETGHGPDGIPSRRVAYDGDTATTRCFWPDGALNTESVTEPGPVWRERFLRCLDPQGRDLAPGGTGRFHQALGESGGRRRWREGRLLDGYLEGAVRWMEAAEDGERETGRAIFRRGAEGPA